ncbi:hypothetical protein PENCOP_c008G02829 [Penicillium coprophilum]|uniref:Uncharacterized protein n=1 Tax=Penicillium coprophilum TaxID=36646 RepID=A0A1V6UJ68_9EURO|nr:hypothetical protein PENCOP_c008G02829 [Penicillium coprophilum]
MKMTVDILCDRLRLVDHDEDPVGEEPILEAPIEKPVPADPVPVEPVPAEPFEESIPEAPIEEPATEEPVVRDPVADWIIPEASPPAEGWHLYNAPAAEDPFGTEEPLADPATEAQTDQTHLTRVSVADLAFYAGWDQMTPGTRAKRRRKLVRKGLPIPNEDGVVAISVA